jgi:tetratricopeptide (TPR) repeat protein
VGGGYLVKGQWSDAARVFSAVLQADPNNYGARYGKAQSLQRVGDLDGALKVLDGKFDGDAGLPLRYLRGEILIQANRNSEGAADIQAVADAAPGRIDMLRSAAAYLSIADEPDRAQKLITAALKLQPDDYWSLQTQAQILDKAGRSEEALQVLDAAVRAKPEVAQPFLVRAAELAKLDRTEDALADLEEAWRINPLDMGTVVTRSQMLRKAGRGGEGPVLFDALVARDHSGSALNNRCWARALANVELAAAETDCAKAVELAPKIGSFWDSYALVAVRDGRLPEAIKRYDKALELTPKQPTSLYGRGYAKIKAGDRAGGEADIAAAKAITAKAGQELIDVGLTVN